VLVDLVVLTTVVVDVLKVVLVDFVVLYVVVVLKVVVVDLDV
jgi:hypothetical protein